MYVKMALSYHKLFALPELQARQKFHIHVYVRRQFRELKHAERSERPSIQAKSSAR